MSENKPTQPGDVSDPLASLHRMSTTAGAASQEYVAVNQIAVATLVLGLASAFVLLSTVMLVIPAVALVCGVFALWQIQHSNGTQTGRGLATLGMLVALGFATMIGVREYRWYAATKAEQVAVEQMLKTFEQKLAAKDYAGALALFTDNFLEKKAITQQQFELTWAKATDSPIYGAIQSVGITHLVPRGVGEQGITIAGSMLVISFEKAPQPLRREVLFRKVDGQWKIDDIPQIFPPPAPTDPGMPGGQPGGVGPSLMPPM